MAFNLKDRIFNYFGVSEKLRDTYKDVNKKGINERFQECLGEGYDDDLQDFIDNGLDNLIVPASMKEVLIPVMEYMLGNIVYISDQASIRRKLIQFAHRLYNVKGTKKGFEIPLRMLGFDTITIVDLITDGTFDSGTFDDDFRTFDSEPGCGCGKYKLIVSGTVVINDAVLEAINRIITFNQPINAELATLEVHGVSGGIGVMIIEDTFIVG